MDTKQLNSARRAKVKALMDEQELSVNDLIIKMDPPQKERQGWINYLYNVRSDNKGAGVTPERAAALAPVLGVKPMDLLIELTEREESRTAAGGSTIHTSSAPSPPIGTMSPNELKIRRGEALNLLMAEKQLSANQLASQIEAEEYQASLLAMKIAEGRQGAELLPADLCKKIAEKMGVEAMSLYIEYLPEEAPALPPPKPQSRPLTSTGSETPQPRRRSRKPGTAGRPKKQVAPDRQEAPLIKEGATAETEVTRIELSPTEFEQLLGCTVAIIQGQDGRYIARLPEKRLSKDEVIQFLLRQLKK